MSMPIILYSISPNPSIVRRMNDLSKEHNKLKSDVEEKLPKIDSIDMHAQFLEERIIDLETLTDKLRNGSQYD